MPRHCQLIGVSLAAVGIAQRNGTSAVDVRRDVAPGLLQTVHVSRAAPKQGDTILFLSTVRNESDAPIEVKVWRTCLKLLGDIQMQDPSQFRWDCLSAFLSLAPGDTIVDGERRVILSPPGSYTVAVQHLIDPDVAASVQINVY